MSSTVLTQIDTPKITFCQASDCSGITMSICKDDYFPFFGITAVSLNVTCGAYTSGDVDITSSIISLLSGQIAYVHMTHDIDSVGSTRFSTELTPGDYFTDSEHPYYVQQVYSITDDNNMSTVNMIYYDTINKPTIKKISTDYLITPSFLGLPGTTLPDGEYTADLSITALVGGSEETFDISTTFAVVCNNFCCLYEKLADFADMCDDCLTNENIKKVLDAMMAWGLLEAYLAAPYCGDTVSFATLNTKLTELCNSTPCKNC